MDVSRVFHKPPKIERFETELLEVKDLTLEDKEFVFSAPPNFTFLAGQFMTILFEHEGKPLRRPYSICSAPHEKNIAICVKKVENGPGTTMLWNLNVGDKINVMAPLGVFTLKPEQKKQDLVFIATGTGVGPFKSMISQLLKDNFEHNITLIAGVRHETGILYPDYFTMLEKEHDNFAYFPTVSKPQADYSGLKGRVTEIITKQITPNQDARFFLCGLYDMIKTVGAQLTSEKQIPKTNIHFERYD